MRATTQYFDAAIDLNDVAGGDGYLFVRDGVGFAGQGIAHSISADTATEFLRTIEHDNQTSLDVGPIAIGNIAFQRMAPATLVIPRQVVGKDEAGKCWITTIDDASPTISPALASQTHTAIFHVQPITPVETYKSAVLAARDAVCSGAITKAVIAREVRVTSSIPIDIHAVLLRLRATFARSYRYSINGFIGASPELLVEIKGDRIRSHPLAGTTPRTGDPETDDELARKLIASMKDQIEHRVVIDVIHEMLLPWCSYLDWEPEPSVIQVANVQHLGTLIEGHLRTVRPTVMEIVRTLSPTPALGGHPRDAALALIAEVEELDRGPYGGAVGWVDGCGNGTWAVAIRCAELSDDRLTARLIAGGGIVAASDPDAELAETQAKFQAMLSAIIRP